MRFTFHTIRDNVFIFIYYKHSVLNFKKLIIFAP